MNKIAMLFVILFFSYFLTYHKRYENLYMPEKINCNLNGIEDGASSMHNCYKGIYIPYLFNVGEYTTDI